MVTVNPSPTTALKWHRGILIATILLFLSYPLYSCGQEAAILADEATSAAAAAATDSDATVDSETVGGDVTDLGDVVCDDMDDLTELMEELDSENLGVVDDVDERTVEELAATADTTPDNGAETAETTAATTTDEVESNPVDAENVAPTSDATSTDSETQAQAEATAPVAQSGPFIDLLGDMLLSLEMVDDTHAQVHQHNTNEILSGKKVVGLYFSADWCGPCKQFTPDLVNFYNKMNSRRGKQNQFEIIWISRCRTADDFGQYFTQMNWLALPPTEAMGERGQQLGDKFKVKGIPSLVLLDEIGNVITLDARNKIPIDKAGIGFPWRSPMNILISALVPRSLRLLVKTQLAGVLDLVKGVLSGKKRK